LITATAATLTGCRSPQTAESPPVTYSKAAATQVIKDAVPFQARPLFLSDVRLTCGPLQHAQELDAKYLLEPAPDRMPFYPDERILHTKLW
jgi:hypothetical protein